MRRIPMYLAGTLVCCVVALLMTGVWWVGVPIAVAFIVGEEWRVRNPEEARRRAAQSS